MKSNKVSLWFPLFFSLLCSRSLFSLRVPSISIPTLYTFCAHSVLYFNCITLLLRYRKRQTEEGRSKIRPSYKFFSFLSFCFIFSYLRPWERYNRDHDGCSWFSPTMRFLRRLKIFLMITVMNLTFDVRSHVAHLRLLEFLKQIAHCYTGL